MISALALLQDVFGAEYSSLNRFLVKDVGLSDDEMRSLNWVIEDPNRNPLLARKADSQEQDFIAHNINDVWKWFMRQGQEPTSICGLAFRLSAIGATRPFKLDFLAKVMKIGTLSRRCTDEDTQNGSQSHDPTQYAISE
jgi:hypothetical protein